MPRYLRPCIPIHTELERYRARDKETDRQKNIYEELQTQKDGDRDRQRQTVRQTDKQKGKDRGRKGVRQR